MASARPLAFASLRILFSLDSRRSPHRVDSLTAPSRFPRQTCPLWPRSVAQTSRARVIALCAGNRGCGRHATASNRSSYWGAASAARQRGRPAAPLKLMMTIRTIAPHVPIAVSFRIADLLRQMIDGWRPITPWPIYPGRRNGGGSCKSLRRHHLEACGHSPSAFPMRTAGSRKAGTTRQPRGSDWTWSSFRPTSRTASA